MHQNVDRILGLSVPYLFALECFTDILPPDQAETLWKQIAVIQDAHDYGDYTLNPEDESRESTVVPDVFTLSGWPEPQAGQAIESGTRWRCWCAAHRPLLPRKGREPSGTETPARDYAPSNSDGSSQSTARGSQAGTSVTAIESRKDEELLAVRDRLLIVLEFELENDTVNPIHPQNTPSPAPTNLFETQPAYNSDDSQHTRKSRPPPPRRTSSSPAENRLSRGVSGPLTTGQEGPRQPGPSPADIRASTSPKSRPIRALEKMRHVSHSGRRSLPMSLASNVGTLDVFAVLREVVAQLDQAQDLEALLNVVVGVIKDLTRFHRVMVYQFDEKWNGQVRLLPHVPDLIAC